MKKAHKAASLVIAGIFAAGVMSLSFMYANNMTDNTDTILENIEIDNVDVNIENIDDYEITIYEFEVDDYNVKSNMTIENIGKLSNLGIAANEAKTKTSEKAIEKTNSYGSFSLDVENGKIKKYKYEDNDSSEKYLVKGSAKFSKKDITFNGYFIVDNTLSGNKKGQLTMYNGKLNLPNGDKFDGYLTSGKYYYSGTYTWKNGQSYTGKFTKSNKIGTATLPENKMSEYGKFYFDSSKKTYLQIRFVEGVPQEAGYYIKSGNKYLVVFKNGVCTSTSIVEK